MSRPFEKISDINESKELWKIGIRVHHKWNVISGNKEHLELIFVDAEGTDIHVIVPTALKATYDPVLVVNNTYTVTTFLPQQNDIVFKASEHPFVIRFTPATRVFDINKHEIPEKKLNLKPFAEILAGNWRNDLLIDVIGVVQDIGYTQTSAGKKHQINLTLKDLVDDTINCTLWENYAMQFMNFVQQNTDAGPTIILLQYAKVKAEGKYPLSVSNTYNITKLLINEDLPDIVHFRKRLSNDLNIGASSQLMCTQSNVWSQNSGGSQITTYDKFMMNATPLSLREIINLPDMAWCVTVATTRKLKATANGWYYQACCKCPKVAKGVAPPYICADRHSTETEIYRYKIEIEVVDNGSSAIFVFWDRECTELLEISAAQLRERMIKDGFDDPLDFPLILDTLIGHEFAFKVKWQPKWKNGSVMAVKSNKETKDRVLAEWEVFKPSVVEVNNEQVNQVRDSVDEAVIVEEWALINELEFTSKFNAPHSPSAASPVMTSKSPKKVMPTSPETVTPITGKAKAPKPQVTPMNSGKRGAQNQSSQAATINELAEGEGSSTRLRRKHVKIEKK